MREKTVAVIGGGLGGLAVVAAIIRRAVDTRQINFSITIYEPNTIGPGVAYDVNAPNAFLLNHELDFMGSLNVRLREVDTKDFYYWVQRNIHALQPAYPHYDLKNPKSYAPRNLYGRYLQARYAELKQYASEHGIQINEQRQKVDHVARVMSNRPGQFEVTADGSARTFDIVILATGNFFNPIDTSLQQTGRCLQPYDYKKYVSTDIDAGSVMFIAGTALSAYDAAIHALESGKYRKVVIASRRGMLRKVRGRTIPYRRKHVTLDNLLRMAGGPSKRFRLEHMLRAVQAEIQEAHKKPVTWKEGYRVNEILSMFDSDISAVQNDQILLWRSIHSSLSDEQRHELYAHLDDEDKVRFAKEFSSLYQLISAPMPIDNAQKIRNFIRDGKLELVNGLERITYDSDKQGFRMHCVHQLDGTPLPVGMTVNKTRIKRSIHPEVGNIYVQATGVGRSVGHIPLYKQMLQDGLVVSHPAGGIRADMSSRLVTDASGAAIPGLYAVGHMTNGETILPHNSIQLGRACYAAAVHIVNIPEPLVSFEGQPDSAERSTLVA